jgi:polysaccharide biosynthesis protein PslG
LSHRDHHSTTGAWRHLAIALTVAALIALLPAAASAALRAAALDSTVQFGVNTGVMFSSEQYTRAQIDQQLAAVAATGATVVRSDALWEDAEPQAPIGVLHRYNWTLDDEIVSSLAAHGLRWLPIIDYAAPWARALPGQAHSPTSNVGAYAAYAAAIASRYGPGGSFWLENPGIHQVPVLDYEIWNEPDSGTFWKPTPNPAAYAALYSAAWSAIKAKQPAAQVLIGGLTRPAWFLQAMLAGDPNLRGQIDGISIHPYGSSPDKVFIAIRAARLAMRADGLGAVPLYVTEIGWTTHGSGFDSATPAERPGYISSTFATLGHTDCGIASVLLYAWSTLERNPSDPNDWFGISPPGAGGSADIAAFAAAVATAAAPAPPALLCTTQPGLIDTRVLPPVVPPKKSHPATNKPRKKPTPERLAPERMVRTRG